MIAKPTLAVLLSLTLGGLALAQGGGAGGAGGSGGAGAGAAGASGGQGGSGTSAGSGGMAVGGGAPAGPVGGGAPAGAVGGGAPSGAVGGAASSGNVGGDTASGRASQNPPTAGGVINSKDAPGGASPAAGMATTGVTNSYQPSAAEPQAEPRQRPVPCSTSARETDGSTTCIGIEPSRR